MHPAYQGGRRALPGPLPAVDGPEEAVLAAEQRAEVAGAFRRLRADQQEVLALRVLGGLSAAQVGEVLGKSEGAVRVAQHRALRSLQGGDGGDRRMTEPRDNGPMGPDDDLAALAGLDLALDELAAGRDPSADEVGGEAAALAALAAELRAAVPAPPPGAAERGRAAFLATAGAGRPRGAAWRRSLPLRLAGLAAALVVLVALPAAARQADPGTALWPVREVGQQVRDRLAGDPVRRANLRLNIAEDYIAAGTGAAEDRREDMADAAEDKIKDALDALKDLSGPEVAAVRARAIHARGQGRGAGPPEGRRRPLRVGRWDQARRRQLRARWRQSSDDNSGRGGGGSGRVPRGPGRARGPGRVRVG